MHYFMAGELSPVCFKLCEICPCSCKSEIGKLSPTCDMAY